MANIKENKKYHYTYKTINLINGRYYLGMHSTNSIDDGYLGSGKRLYYELNKYGRDNFKFEILKYFNSREELVQAEISLITEHDLKNPNCLNLSVGGSGGIHNKAHYDAFVKGPKDKVARFEKQAELRKDPEWAKWHAAQRSLGLKKSYENREGPFKGRKHTQDTVDKMKTSHKGVHAGSKNSQFGKPRSEETKQKIRESIKKTLEEKRKKAQNGE
mgnify:FL=1